MRRELQILNQMGLHARPASEFVKAVRQFKSTVTICKDGASFSASSILEVLSANLDCGSQLIIDAEGPDATEVLDRLAQLLEEFRVQEGSCADSAR